MCGMVVFGVSDRNAIANALNDILTAPIYTEEQIIGTALEDVAVSGTKDIDLDSLSYARYVLTGVTTITTSNTPSSGESKVINLMVSGNFSLTLPVSWTVIGSYDGAVENYFSIVFSNLPVEGDAVTCYINQA